jgi:hypothetical protein
MRKKIIIWALSFGQKLSFASFVFTSYRKKTKNWKSLQIKEEYHNGY